MQAALAFALNVLIFAPVVFVLITVPDEIGRGTIAAGSFLGWLAFGVTFAADVWFLRTRGLKIPAFFFARTLWGLSCLIAFSVAESGGWRALHVLTVALTTLIASEDNVAIVP